MSLLDQERQDIVNYRLNKAQATLQEAKDNVSFKHWVLIANRLYYATYYAVSGLIASGHRVKSHEGTLTQFGLHFVKNGVLPSSAGRFYRQLFTLRLTGDYEDNFDLIEEDVIPLIEPTEQLITQISTLAKEALNNNIS